MTVPGRRGGVGGRLAPKTSRTRDKALARSASGCRVQAVLRLEGPRLHLGLVQVAQVIPELHCMVVTQKVFVQAKAVGKTWARKRTFPSEPGVCAVMPSRSSPSGRSRSPRPEPLATDASPPALPRGEEKDAAVAVGFVADKSGRMSRNLY